MATTPASRPSSRRALGLTAVLALVLIGAVPGVAQAAGELVGGATSAAAVPLPLAPDDPNAAIGVSNVGITSTATHSPAAQPFWSNVAWYSYTPSITGNVYLRATSLSPLGWDNTLEVWTAAGTFVTMNDDSYGLDAALLVTLNAGTTYHIGMGGYHSGARGTVTLTFSNRVPSSPQDVQATAGDESAVITWAPPADLAGGVVGYTVLCTPEGGAEVTCGQTSGTPPVTSVTVPDLTNGVVYGVRVTAQNFIGASEPSGSATFTPKAPSVTTVWTDPTPPVSGDPYDLVIQVMSHDVAVPDGNIDVDIDGTPYTDVPLVGGLATVSMPAHLAGFVPVEVTYAGTAAILSGGTDVAFEVAKRSQTVDFTALPAGLTYAGDPVTLVASATFGMPVTFSASGACTVDGDVLTLSGVGDCTVTAAQAGDSETEPASSSQTVSVGLRPQALTLDELAPMVYGQTPVAIVAISSVGLPVTVVAEGACALVGDELTTTGIGDCVVTATQAGDALNAPAEAVVRTAVVAKRPDTITLSTLPALIRGSASIPVTATSLYDLPVTIVATGICTFAGGFVSMVDVGTCTVTATSDGDEVTEPASAATSATVVAEPASVLAQIVGQVGDAVTSASGRASGTWLRPGTALILTVYSAPQSVGSIPARLDGTAMATWTLPALAEGTHHLVARGTALDGTVVEDSLAFGVDEDGIIVWIGTAPALASALAGTGADVQEAGMLAVLWLITGASLLAIRRRFVLRRGAALA